MNNRAFLKTLDFFLYFDISGAPPLWVALVVTLALTELMKASISVNLSSLLTVGYLAMLSYISTYFIATWLWGKVLPSIYRGRVEVVDGVTVVYPKKALLTSATIWLGRPIVFISPQHKGDEVTLMHELGHAKSKFFSFVSPFFPIFLFLMFGAMFVNYGDLYFNQAFTWVVGFALAAIFMYHLHYVDELYAEHYAIRRLGEKALENRARELFDVVQREVSPGGIRGTLGKFFIHVLYPGLPTDLEGIRNYLRSLEVDWSRPIGAFRLVLPWIFAFGGTAAYLIGVLADISDLRTLLLYFAIASLSALMTSFLLALILKPFVARFVSDSFKISLWLSSIYLFSSIFPVPAGLFINHTFFLILPILLFIMLFFASRPFTENNKKALMLTIVTFAVLYAISAVIGLIVTWKLFRLKWP